MLLEHWDEKLDGKLEEDTVVEQVIKGQGLGPGFLGAVFVLSYNFLDASNMFPIDFFVDYNLAAAG